MTVPASYSINFNSSYTISNLLCASTTVLSTPSLFLSAPSLIYFAMGASATSVFFYKILGASASASVIFFAAFFEFPFSTSATKYVRMFFPPVLPLSS